MLVFTICGTTAPGFNDVWRLSTTLWDAIRTVNSPQLQQLCWADSVGTALDSLAGSAARYGGLHLVALDTLMTAVGGAACSDSPPCQSPPLE
jgi:hypothetical protein